MNLAPNTPDPSANQTVLKYGWRVHKFATRPLWQDKRINVLDGSVRSGKTWAIHPKIMRACHEPIRGGRVLIGQTSGTVYTNVLKDLFDLLDDRDYSYSEHTGHLRILGVPWKILGARDVASEKYVRGSTIGVAVVDEAVLMPESFWDMLLTRLSPPGARLYATTNPDNPMHWLKVRFLDEAEGILKDQVNHLHMTMDDNPNLPADYIHSLKNYYKGMFYKRFILGQWVMAEGSIWGDAWSDELIFDELPATFHNTVGGARDHWISNDYGTNHPHVYQEFWDDGDTVWLTREWVWDSQERMRQLTDGQYADELMKFMGPNAGCQVIIPPEALSFRQECINRGIWVCEAKNEVTEGLQSVAGMMAARKLRIHRSCVRTLRGIMAHVWDPNKAKRGVEEPVKKDDDEADCLRYGIHTKIPKYRYMLAAA